MLCDCPVLQSDYVLIYLGFPSCALPPKLGFTRENDYESFDP